MKLKNKSALVAGATKGIGLAIARSLAAKGIRLILPLHDDWPKASKALQDEFGCSRQKHIFIQTDLRNRSDVNKMVSIIQEKVGSLDILINNIERGGMPVVHGSYNQEINRDQWQLELDTTLLAKKLIFEACLPLLKEAEQASVINISSIAGLTGRTGPAGLIFSDGYAAANRGIASFTENWARIGAPSVRVNEIMVGLIDTRHGKKTRGWQSLTSEQKTQLLGHTLLGRTGTPKEIVKTVHFLISNADYITGTVIRVDGGFVLGGEEVPPMPDGVI
jgi:3-oxoacyl-[acyl-carrier protein] reductase